MSTRYKNVFVGLIILLACVFLLLYTQLDTGKRQAIISSNAFNIAQTRVVEETTLVKPSTCVEREPQKTIPKIIHQVWNGEILPTVFIEHVRSLVRDNPYPEWDYYFWTKEAGAEFIKDKYPYLLDRFNNESATCNTMRADMLRILAIHQYGGVYFDLDTMSVRPLAGFVDTRECSLATEPREHALTQNLDVLITNSAIFCRKGHPFFKHLLYRLSTLKLKCWNPFLCTGPLLLTPLYMEINRTNGDTVTLPEVQSSKLFQDVYDIKSEDLQKYLTKLCSHENSKTRTPGQTDTCLEWEARGRWNRTLSELAYTYHTWYHVYGKVLEESPTNSIFNIVPHAKVYGHNL